MARLTKEEFGTIREMNRQGYKPGNIDTENLIDTIDALEAEIAALKVKLSSADETIEVLGDSEIVKGIASGIKDLNTGRIYSLPELDTIEELKCEIAALREPMDCGHPKPCWQWGPEAEDSLGHREAEGHCTACEHERLAVAAALRKAAAHQMHLIFSVSTGTIGGIAVNADASMNVAIRPTVTDASPSEEPLLLPETLWNQLPKERQEQLRKWFDLATKYLQAILDERLFDDKAALDAYVAQKVAEQVVALAKAAEVFAARVEERNPEWFREECGSTDFSIADHALRESLAANRAKVNANKE